MKKLFFIAAFASAALVGCTKNEVAPSALQQDEITFLAPVVGAQTKVNGLIGSTYNTGESFDVWCVHNAGNITEWTGAVYFDDVKAEYDASLGGWALVDKYYWPSTGKLSFVALSPSISNSTSYADATGFVIDNWSQGADQDAIVDLMYSDEVLNKVKAEYAADGEDKAGDTNTTYIYKGVDIKFNHALSYLVFKVKTTGDYSATTKFRLNSITLSGVYTTGDFQQMTNASTPNTDPWTEDETGATGTYVAYTGGTLNFGNSEVNVPETATKQIILLPQALKADQQKITVNYEISTDDKAIDDPSKVWIAQTPEAVDLTNLTVDEWEMGKKYIYTITIGMNEIIFDPAVSAWDTATDAPVSF